MFVQTVQTQIRQLLQELPDLDLLCLWKYDRSDPILVDMTSIFSSPEPKAQGELIIWDSSRRLCVRASTLSNMNISETSWPIVIKFYLEHHWGGGLAA